MAKLSAVSACIFALVILLGAASTAGTDIFTYELSGSYAESNGCPSLVPNGLRWLHSGDHSGCRCPRPHRWRWPAGPDFGECWPAHMVATAAEKRLRE